MLAVALGSDPIRVGCTPEQRRRWLTRVANEGLIVAYGVTEPEAGSNVQNLATTADRITDASGNITHYRLNGIKQFISNGSIASLYTILAKAPDGPTFFVIERNTPGLTAGKHEVKHGIRLSDTSQVLLQDVVIPADRIVGTREGDGLKQANEVFGYTRLMVAAFGLGAGLSALEKAIAYSKVRKQFGTYLCEKQGYTHKLLVPSSVKLAAAQAYISTSPTCWMPATRIARLRDPSPSSSRRRWRTWWPTSRSRRWAGTATAWISRSRRFAATRGF